ncbi:hypothetical protein [Streptomyces dysideae]|uniref:hypothetical protein n=1 Tax=Streptomyces dysideae TaxID=909626 RepID=UPI0018FE8ADD|nr:hypothetical protein [Streptomyces dysideae]
MLLTAFDERGPRSSPHPHQDRACGYLQLGLALRAGGLLAVNAYLPRRRPPGDSTYGGPLFTSRTGIKMPHRCPHDLLRAVAVASGLLSPPV